MQTLMYPSGKRQYLHKMQMLEMNRKRQEVNMRRRRELYLPNVCYIIAVLAREYVKHSSPDLT